MLEFSEEAITFTYTEKGNPECTLTLANKSESPIYYKVESNRNFSSK